MARDMQVDLLVNPIIDTKKFDAGLKTLQRMANKGVSGLSSKESATFESLATRLMASLMVSGRAKTSTQARLQIQDMLGSVSGTTKSALRGAQNISDFVIKSGRVVPYESFSAKQIKGWRGDLGSVATAYNNMLSSYAAFKGTPSKETQQELIKAVMLVNTQLANIGKDRKTEIKTFGQIEKATKAIHKEAKDFTKPTETANALGAAAAIKGTMKGIMRGALGMFGLSSVWNALKKLGSMGIQGIQEGYNDLVEQSVYGQNRNIAGTRALSKMYGMKEESLVGAERYALDFRQRMMMGEVSDREFIALSKMGTLGQMIVSGEAGRNPVQFQKAIQDYIRANKGNEAEIRQNLRYLGWNPDIMAYGAIEHTGAREQQIAGVYEDLVRQNKISALSTLIPSQIYKTAKDQVKTTSGRFWRSIFGGEESLDLLYRSMTRGAGFTAGEIEASYDDLVRRNNEYYSGGYSSLESLANSILPGISQLYKANLDTQTSIAETYKALPISTKDGTKEGAKEGIIEGLQEVLQNSANRSNFDQTTMCLTNFSLSNGGAS